jgi:hypothetical protein
MRCESERVVGPCVPDNHMWPGCGAGVWDEHSSLYLLHEPAEDTDHTVFRFNVTTDRTGVDVIRQQYGVRTSNVDDALAVKLGATSSWVATLPIVTINDRNGPSVVVDASEMVDSGFFITDVAQAFSRRIDLSSCHAYPNNLDLTVEYQVRPSAPVTPCPGQTIADSRSTYTPK